MTSVHHQEFWLVERPGELISTAAYATVVGPFRGTESGTNTRCLACGAVRIERQRRVEVELFGENVLDFVWSDGIELFVTDHTRARLQSNEVLGLEWWPVSIVAWWRSEMPGGEITNWLERGNPPALFNIGITAVVGRKHQVGDHVICSTCGRMQPQMLPPVPDTGVHDEKSLPAIFTVQGYPGYIFVNATGREALLGLQVQNLDFVLPEDPR